MVKKLGLQLGVSYVTEAKKRGRERRGSFLMVLRPFYMIYNKELNRTLELPHFLFFELVSKETFGDRTHHKKKAPKKGPRKKIRTSQQFKPQSFVSFFFFLAVKT